MTTADVRQRWFRRFAGPARPRLRLVCFAHAGGSASFFRTWPRWLPDDVEVLAVRYPGRQDRLAEPCIARLDEMTDQIEDALSILPGLPVAFFGHSMGSAVAFQVASRLERDRGQQLEALFVSAGAPPHLYEPGELHLSDDETLIAALRKLGAVDGELFADPELRAMVLPSIRSDFELIETFRPGPPVPIAAPIHLYSGQDDPSVDLPTLRRWQDLTTADFTERIFPGDHFYLVPNEADLAKEIARHL